MILFELLKRLDYTVDNIGVRFDDMEEGFYIDINYDPEDSYNNKCEIKTDQAEIKLSEVKECKLYDFLHSLWLEEIEANQYDKELNREQLNNILSYGI